MENTTEQLKSAERKHDDIYNEGADGYNPFSDELERRSIETECNRPKSRTEHKHQISERLQVIDCAVAREWDADANADEIKSLREEQEAIVTAEADEFASEWTLEVTVARRAEWNDRVRNGQFGTRKTDFAKVNQQQLDQGWSIEQLKKAIALHGIK